MQRISTAMKVLAMAAGAVIAGGVSGCSGNGNRSAFDTSDPDASLGGPVTGPASPGALGNGDAGSPPPAQGTGTSLLYAHTDTTLYQADPEDLSKPLTKIGDFACAGLGGGSGGAAMTDLAVTKDGKLFGVSEGAAYPLTIAGNTVTCDATWMLPQTKFYGLTVAPENTVAADERLIGADGKGGLYEIDQSSGTPTQVGTLGTDVKTGLPWALSGDIVFLANAGNPIGFATVRSCTTATTCSKTDTLIEVDVKAIKPGTQSVLKAVRGAVTKGSWCTNAASPTTFGSMFGIVAYKDKVYGFSRAGDIVEIHNTDGSGCLISNDPTTKFAGAGITTTAPVIAPPAVN